MLKFNLDKLDGLELVPDGISPTEGRDAVAYSAAISAKRSADALEVIAKHLAPPIIKQDAVHQFSGGTLGDSPDAQLRSVDWRGDGKALDDFAKGWIKRGDDSWGSFRGLSMSTLIEICRTDHRSMALLGDAIDWETGPSELKRHITAWRFKP